MRHQPSDRHPVIDSLRQRASALRKTVALPETEDDRTFYATATALDEDICQVLLVGDPDHIAQRLGALSVSTDAVRIVDPTDDETIARCAQVYTEARPHESPTEEEARQVVADPLYCATCLLKMGEVDATVAGASHSTAKVLRPLLRIVGCAPEVETVSSCFIMTIPHSQAGHEGVLLFADCGVAVSYTHLTLPTILLV